MTKKLRMSNFHAAVTVISDSERRVALFEMGTRIALTTVRMSVKYRLASVGPIALHGGCVPFSRHTPRPFEHRVRKGK